MSLSFDVTHEGVRYTGHGSQLADILLPATLNRAQVAQLWGVSLGTVSKYVKRGTIPAPIAGSRKWSKAAVIRARDIGTARDVDKTADAPSPLEQWKQTRGRR